MRRQSFAFYDLDSIALLCVRYERYFIFENGEGA